MTAHRAPHSASRKGEAFADRRSDLSGPLPANASPRQAPLPKGWRWAKLEEVCQQDRRVVEPGSSLAASLPYLSLEHVESDTGRILRHPSEAIEEEGQSTTFAFDSRHVLYGKLRPYLNKVALPDFEGRCTTELIPLLPQEIDRYFLAWILRRSETVEAAMREKTGSRMPRANMEDLLALEVPLPPLLEQQRIAAVLNEQMTAVEKARAAAKAQLEAARALPAAYLREVFESEEAMGWPHKRLGELCEIQLGKMLSPASKTGNRPRPYLRNANVQWGRFDLNDIAEMDFTEEQEQKLALKPGDLVVCEGGEPGRAAVWEGQIEPCYYQKALHRLRPINQSIDPHFIMYRLWYSSLKGEFTDSQAKTTIAHLPVVRLQELPIYLPALTLQRTIAETLNGQFANTERTRELLEAQLAAIEQLPGALLRRAFQGEI